MNPEKYEYVRRRVTHHIVYGYLEEGIGLDDRFFEMIKPLQ